ncbi:hypothetical protein FIBSPDRAFT_849929 [Athelia psychrophila]|uniref:Uncharacterized protein n=1 Tax=Athelia psychrophila TaxID=1759441 RepID=A0A166TSC9_9AGAM|nr:hypothetical protein FIBSPDRAFT_849929 [Fibularhizoctonia sp. CBS 109695]
MDISDIVQQTQAATYVIWCALSLWSWDWALALAEEYETVKICGRSCAMLAYVIARISTGILCVFVLVFYMGTLNNDCNSSAFLGIGISITIGTAAKSWLFLMRVRAIYSNSKLVTVIAGVGWLGVVGTRATVAFLVHASPVPGHTGFCAISGFALIPVIALWLNWAYDTCIYIAISVKLTSYTTSSTNSRNLSSFRGDGLPHTMRHLLNDGHAYYLYVFAISPVSYGIKRTIFSTTIFFILFAAIITVSSQTGPTIRASFSITAFAIETNMTCKIFRAMILRSVDVDHNVFLTPVETHTTATSFELTALELQTQTPDEREQG